MPTQMQDYVGEHYGVVFYSKRLFEMLRFKTEISIIGLELSHGTMQTTESILKSNKQAKQAYVNFLHLVIRQKEDDLCDNLEQKPSLDVSSCSSYWCDLIGRWEWLEKMY